MAWRIDNVSTLCQFLFYSGELGHKKCVEFAHGMAMELEYVPLIILLYILAK